MADDAGMDREQLLKEVAALRAELEEVLQQASSETLDRSEARLRNAQRIARLGPTAGRFRAAAPRPPRRRGAHRHGRAG